jgi:hypothetical protein
LALEPKQYDIDYGIFIHNQAQAQPIGETYHFITNVESVGEHADICLPVQKLGHLYHNYKHIVIKYFDGILPQIFFDAAYYSGSVFFDVPDRSLLDTYLVKSLGDENKCNLNDMDSGSIRNIIIKKHTCLHRAKSLLSQLPCKEYTDNLQQIIERSIK